MARVVRQRTPRVALPRAAGRDGYHAMPIPRSASPLRLWAALLAFALIVAAPTGSALTAPDVGEDDAVAERPITTAEYCADGEEQAFLALINAYRAQNGLGALAMSQTLGAAAEHHSLDMANNNYFSHTMLDGTTVEQNLQNHGYPDGTYGENIAAGMATADVALTTWQNSPGHNANMLRSSYQAIGIARAYNANSEYGWYWTTIFGGTFDVPATLCGGAPPPPAPGPTPTTGANATVTTLLNLRAGPGLDQTILTTMSAGSRIAVTGAAQNGFYPVTYGTVSGWAAV